MYPTCTNKKINNFVGFILWLFNKYMHVKPAKLFFFILIHNDLISLTTGFDQQDFVSFNHRVFFIYTL